MKRLFDLIIVIPAFILSIPIIVLLAILVRIESKGNPIFAQTRVGKNGSTFTIYKVRSMTTEAPNVATHEAPEAHITKMGAFVRKTKLDELPQLLNVIRGEMSLVGPRPCLPTQSELIEARKRWGVDHLLPGITGLSQVRGIDMSDPEKLAQSDADYPPLSTISFDIRLCFRNHSWQSRLLGPIHETFDHRSDGLHRLTPHRRSHPVFVQPSRPANQSIRATRALPIRR